MEVLDVYIIIIIITTTVILIPKQIIYKPNQITFEL